MLQNQEDKKTIMNPKNLVPQMVNSVNHITIQDLPAELVEMSEEELQQVVGGIEPPKLSLSLGVGINENVSVNLGVKFKLDKLDWPSLSVGVSIPIKL